MKVSEFTFDSSTAHNKIFTRLYEPDGEPKAVLQISHGMAEHSALYKPFCEYMAQRGFVVVINDHLGHGRSVTSGALYGHFGEKGGLYNVVEDQRNLQSIMREKYPGAVRPRQKSAVHACCVAPVCLSRQRAAYAERVYGNYLIIDFSIKITNRKD